MTKLRPLSAFLAAFVFFLNSALGAEPAISTQPVSQNVLVGAAVTLSVTATGTGTLTYQWRKNGIDLPGATSATYTIASATVSESGSYTVVVTNADGSTPSNAAILTVYPDPSIVTQPANREVIAGATVQFSVVAIGSGTLSYEWRKGGITIPNAVSASYGILNVTPAHAGDYTVLVKNTVGETVGEIPSAIATLVVKPLPEIATQPAGTYVDVGGSATFSVGATGTGTLKYQWQKGTTNIDGATSNSFTINSVQAADAGSYRVIVTDDIGSTTSSAAALIVNVASEAPAPDGYAASVTGGANGTATPVNTAAAFRAAAEDATTRIITVSGNLDLGATKVAVKSNKTIQGADANATLTGNLELASGVSNVIIRGLNITNPTGYGNGDGISIVGATNVYITHCSVFDCTDGLIDITAGADNVTVSWCEFYYSSTDPLAAHRYAMTVGAATGETKALRVTLHHNWWSDHVDQSMPVTNWGQIHMHSNLLTSVGNTAATKVQASAQLLSERNQYTGVKDPLVKSDGGLIRINNNTYTNTTLATGTTAEAGTDTVFTPSYSYEMLPASDWTPVLQSLAGNTAGAGSLSPKMASAAAVSDVAAPTAGGSFTLSATLTGFSTDEDVAYQWRLNNAPVVGGDRKTLTFNNAAAGQYGPYTVVILKSSGASVVSAPVTVTVNAASTTPPSETPSDDGGGSPSMWFLGVLSLLCTARAVMRRRA